VAVLAVLAGCGGAAVDPDLAASAAFVRGLVDADHDGHFARSEYEAVAYRAPPFEAVDRNGDGDLDADEVALLIAGENPVDLDPLAHSGPNAGTSASGRTVPRPAEPPDQHAVGSAATRQPDQPPGRSADGPAGPPPQATATPDPGVLRRVYLADMVRFLVAEVQAVDPDWPAPGGEHIREACDSGRLDDPAVQAILHDLARRCHELGRPFPEELLR